MIKKLHSFLIKCKTRWQRRDEVFPGYRITSRGRAEIYDLERFLCTPEAQAQIQAAARIQRDFPNQPFDLDEFLKFQDEWHAKKDQDK